MRCRRGALTGIDSQPTLAFVVNDVVFVYVALIRRQWKRVSVHLKTRTQFIMSQISHYSGVTRENIIRLGWDPCAFGPCAFF